MTVPIAAPRWVFGAVARVRSTPSGAVSQIGMLVVAGVGISATHWAAVATVVLPATAVLALVLMWLSWRVPEKTLGRGVLITTVVALAVGAVVASGFELFLLLVAMTAPFTIGGVLVGLNHRHGPRAPRRIPPKQRPSAV